MKTYLIGTSGYSYRHWIGPFYPQGLPENKWLEHYCRFFNSVELNVTFYRLPGKKAFQGWYDKTPDRFRFVVKGSRYITHIKKLGNPEDSLKYFFENAAFLKEKLVCVLWQLPPFLKCNMEKLSAFVKVLDKKYSFCRHSFEFRHDTWYNEEVYDLFKTYHMNLCIPDSPEYPAKEVITSDFIYLRFHGGKVLYASEYSEEELSGWGEKISRWMKKSKMLLAFFDNDAEAFAVKNAMRLREIQKESV